MYVCMYVCMYLSIHIPASEPQAVKERQSGQQRRPVRSVPRSRSAASVWRAVDLLFDLPGLPKSAVLDVALDTSAH